MRGTSGAGAKPAWRLAAGAVFGFLLACAQGPPPVEASAAADPVHRDVAAAPERFDFVQLADPQISRTETERDLENLKRAARQIRALEPKPAFVVICGDLVDVGSPATRAAFDEGLAAFDLPVHLIPGNHDVIVPPRASSLASFRKRHGGDTFAFEHGGYSFIGVNNQFWFPEVRDAKGALKAAMSADVAREADLHDAWFEAQLTAASRAKRPVIVVGHYPVFLETPDDPVYFRGLMRNLPPARRRQLFSLFRRHGVVAYLAGHTHANYVAEHEGVAYVTTARPGPNIARGRKENGDLLIDPPGFRVWSVRGGAALEHRYVVLEEDR